MSQISTKDNMILSRACVANLGLYVNSFKVSYPHCRREQNYWYNIWVCFVSYIADNRNLFSFSLSSWSYLDFASNTKEGKKTIIKSNSQLIISIKSDLLIGLVLLIIFLLLKFQSSFYLFLLYKENRKNRY